MISFDMGANKSFMSNILYLNFPLLHSLPKFVSRTKYISLDSGQYVGVLFIIPVVINVHEHRFEVYNLVSRDSQ